jgi:hypothetical protein
VGPPNSPVVHRIVTVHYPVHLLAPAPTLRAQSALFTVHCSFCTRPLAQLAITPLSTPDSSVNYSGGHFQKSEGGKFGVDLPGASDTVRWHIGQSDAPDQAAFDCLLLFLFEPFLELYIGLC